MEKKRELVDFLSERLLEMLQPTTIKRTQLKKWILEGLEMWEEEQEADDLDVELDED